MSSRAPAPPPLRIGPVRTPATSPTTSPCSDSSRTQSFASDDYLLMMSSISSPTTKVPAGHRIKPQKVNANSYCGRHSDEYLFGPVANSFGDLWHSMKKKK